MLDSSCTKNHPNNRTTSLGVFLKTPDPLLEFSPSPSARTPTSHINAGHATNLGVLRTSAKSLDEPDHPSSSVTDIDWNCPKQDHAPHKRSAHSNRPRHNNHPSVRYGLARSRPDQTTQGRPQQPSTDPSRHGGISHHHLAPPKGRRNLRRTSIP